MNPEDNDWALRERIQVLTGELQSARRRERVWAMLWRSGAAAEHRGG